MGYKDLVEVKKDNEFNSDLFERFINMCDTSTLQTEFYTSKDEQTKKSLKLHDEMFNDNRSIYAVTLLLPINDIHKAYRHINDLLFCEHLWHIVLPFLPC